jgi:hypothetical protein
MTEVHHYDFFFPVSLLIIDHVVFILLCDFVILLSYTFLASLMTLASTSQYFK